MLFKRVIIIPSNQVDNIYDITWKERWESLAKGLFSGKEKLHPTIGKYREPAKKKRLQAC